MRVQAIDCETELIRPGLLAPPMACTSWAGPGPVTDGLNTGLVHVRDAESVWRSWLSDSALTLTTLNGPYDLAVVAAQFPRLLPLILDAYDSSRIRDIRDQQRLIDIAYAELGGRWIRDDKAKHGCRFKRYGYSLAELTLRHFAEVLPKGADTWRLRYSELIPLELEQWPKDATDYAIRDAVSTFRIDAKQWSEYGALLGDTYNQARANFALHLMSCRGIRTDPEACRRLTTECEREIQRCRDLCVAHGLIRNGKGTKDLKAAREYMLLRLLAGAGLLADHLETLRAGVVSSAAHRILRFGQPVSAYVDVPIEGTWIRVKLTDTGAVSLDADACTDSADPVLRAYATYTSATTLLTKAKRLQLGTVVPLQTRYEVLLETGRTSSSAPRHPLVGDNFQNFRRSALRTEHGIELPGQRECIRARPGYVFCSVDLDNAEMRAMAQICLWVVGHSKLAETLNAGRDVHSALAAARLMGAPMTYEAFAALLAAKDPAAKHARQFAKIPNFALLGGARGPTLIPFAKHVGIVLTSVQADELECAFHEEWTEVSLYHEWIRKQMVGGQVDFQQFISNRVRGMCSYTAACNSGFQGLVADAAKAALLPLVRAGYVDRGSAFYGSYPVLFIHDEVVAEVPEARAHEAAYEMRDLMLQATRPYFPDVPMTASPALMYRIYKDAQTQHDANGRLTVWQPKSLAA